MIELLQVLKVSGNKEWKETLKIIDDLGQAGDAFGTNVSVSGNGKVIAIGSPKDDGAANDIGSVSIYSLVGGNWVKEVRIDNFDPTASDQFGTSVCLSQDGNILAIGKPLDNTLALRAGAVYIYEKVDGVWSFKTKVFAFDGGGSDYFGRSLAVSDNGETIIVGSWGNDTKGLDSGAVYIFVREGETWVNQAKLVASDGGSQDIFGYYVSISGDGNIAAITSYQDDDKGSNAGAAYIFVRTDATWSQKVKLVASDGASSDNFGRSVSISKDGNTLAIGSTGDDDMGSASGSVYIFVNNGVTWIQQAKLVAGDGAASDNFGVSVSLSRDGNLLAVGSNLDDDVSSSSGSVYIFDRTGTVWNQQTKLTASDPETNANFGFVVSLDETGTLLSVGAHLSDTLGTDSGSVYIFNFK